MGKVNPIPPSLTDEQIKRFWSHVNKSFGQGPNGDCWEWTKKREKGGYGHVAVSVGYQQVRHLKASRVAFFLTYNYWPLKLICHHCDNPPCCNPNHLFEGDTKANMTDASIKGRLPTGDNSWPRLKPELVPKGSQRGQVKLNETQVLSIRSRVLNGELQYVIAKEYGISKQLVCRIMKRQNWSHI